MAVAAKRRRATAALPAIQERLRYLEKRRGMLDYAWYQARGYPIGSGRVESANKLVLERRLKGTGMHWARAHVNAMVALRTIACSDRWSEAWPKITQHIRHHSWQGRVHRQKHRRPSPSPVLSAHLPPHPSRNRCRCRDNLRRPRRLHLRLPSSRIARPLTSPGGASALAASELRCSYGERTPVPIVCGSI